MFKKIFLILLLLGNGQNRGREVAEICEKETSGYKSEKSEMLMTLIDSNGEKITREMIFLFVEGNVVNKSLIEFIVPKDVKGTKLLTWTHKEKDDEQWLYLPSLRRVKRISGSNKRSSFMGSEFSYEDLIQEDIDKFTYSLRSEDEKYWILERFPKNKNSGYYKQVVKISKKMKIPIETIYYDLKKEVLKKALTEGFKSYDIEDKKYWRYELITMSNVKTGKKSVINWKNRELSIKINSYKLNKTSLK